MKHKRITLLAGHYGSGKTNIAVNLALEYKKSNEDVTIADLDIVNPYFRTKDSQQELERAGIKLICSEFAGSNVDVPALPQDMYSICDDKSKTAVMDIGGDDRGALALGRYAPAILEENSYEMLLVINRYRPLTRRPEDVEEIRREIERAAGIPFTAIVNNSNIGVETTAEDVLSSIAFGNETAKLTSLPVKFVSVDEKIYDELKDKIPNLFPMKLQKIIK